MNVQSKKEYLIERLNHKDVLVRLESLRELMRMIWAGELKAPIAGEDVNNHIHTTYSFSPYSPTKAVWMAYNAGLKTAGIMDHDSLSGAREFIEAGRIVGIMTTIGTECRGNMKDTPLWDKRINNPDQKGIAYMALHGVPHQNIDAVIDFFRPYSEQRNLRNRKMVDNINALTAHAGITIDFDRDVYPLSNSFLGGSVTERHLLYALSKKITARLGKGTAVVEFLERDLAMPLSAKVRNYLLDPENNVYEYDLLGALKSNMVEKFYVDADAECPSVRDVIDLGRRIGAISAYAYLGDVGDSVTGDKKAQKFEDDYIDLLFDTLKEVGFNAVTYMPSRNTPEQLRHVREMCDRYGLFQISGEDINSPRQKFICEAQRAPEFANLHDATLRLIRHEQEATQDITKAMFYVPGVTVNCEEG